MRGQEDRNKHTTQKCRYYCNKISIKPRRFWEQVFELNSGFVWLTYHEMRCDFLESSVFSARIREGGEFLVPEALAVSNHSNELGDFTLS